MLHQQTENIGQKVDLVTGIQSRAPIVTGAHRSSYDGYVTEHDDYATLGGITPAPCSTGMIVNPRTDTILLMGPPYKKIL